MSDRDTNARSRSASPSNVDSDIKKEGSVKREESLSPSNHPRGHSRSRSPTDHRVKKSYSRSPSRHSRKVSYRDRERSEREHSERRGERPRYRSRSRSRSSRRRARYSYSRSRSHSRGRYGRSRSHSPMSSRRRHIGTRENPKESRCVGVFGLSTSTSENQLYNLFAKYGPIDTVQVVIDKKTGRSRGFGFVYYKNSDDAKVAKETCSGMEIDGKFIRVDFSITQRAHTPTPGIYMGKPTYVYVHDRHNDRRGRDKGDDYYSDRYRERGSYRDRRSPSPKHKSRRYERSRSRSYSPHKYRRY
ncbi:transformer-2 protein homolog beta-like isoform X2 [Chrysoperla carnea]|uniref:transformer-2 protein homolog beta-like isoform X2 n=1 Tax=Chrysoperla carnea TaxID=189513 RepID=UPI001D08E6FC|nr:transformer-2 protein homolog beta-like isoform X2 [Chrysoperla carnea]